MNESPSTNLTTGAPHNGVIAAATATSLLEAHLLWAALNIATVPIETGFKFPQMKDWDELGHPSEAQIRAWHASGKYSGIGVRPGAQSGGLLIIDLDDPIIEKTFSQRFPEKLETYTERTGGGGLHLMYLVERPPQVKTTKIKQALVIDGQATKIEVFFDSGQVVVAPSIHPNGKRYEAVKLLPPLKLHDIDDVVEWIYSLPTPRQIEASFAQPQQPAIPTKPGAKRAYAVKALDSLSAEVARLTNVENDFQNDTCYVNVWKAAHFVDRGDLTRGEIFAAFESAMRSNGYIAAFGYHAFSATFESGFRNGVGDTAYVPKCYQQKPKPVRIVQEVRDQGITSLDYAQLPNQMRLWQGAPMTICCPEYMLIEQHVRLLGVNDFTAAQLGESAGISSATAQRWIDKVLRWKAISERFADLKSNGVGTNTLFKNEKRQLRGAAVARHYCLTPELAQPMIDRFLPDYVQELMERGTPDIVRLEEALAAGLDEQAAARLELTTSEVSRTIEADEVIANNERRALQKAREIQRLAEVDETPFLPDTPACSLSELRAQRIEALIATKPNANWLHSELMWVAGVKRGSVSSLIKKTRYTPADVPTYLDVPVQGSDLRQAVRVACGKHKGAAVAWLDINNEVICGFSGRVPAGAAGVKLNLGKQYIRRANIEPLPPPPADDNPIVDNPPTQESEALVAEREQKKMRRFLLPRLRGCMEAQRWRFVPGPYGYWERRVDGVWQTCENTWDGMVNALLSDYEWASTQRAQRGETLLDGVDLLGADVQVIAS